MHAIVLLQPYVTWRFYFCYTLICIHPVQSRFLPPPLHSMHCQPVVTTLQVVCLGRVVGYGGALLRQDWHPHPQQVRLWKLTSDMLSSHVYNAKLWFVVLASTLQLRLA